MKHQSQVQYHQENIFKKILEGSFTCPTNNWVKGALVTKIRFVLATKIREVWAVYGKIIVVFCILTFVNEVVLESLLFNLDRFYTLFWRFYC